MKHPVPVIVACGALALGAIGFATGSAQQQPQQPPPRPAAPAPSADPYANNAAPGASEFPLAAPAGTDSRARDTAPAGAANSGPFDPATWKYGNAFAPPAGAKLWNPVKVKMQAGGKVTGGTLFGATDPSTYCAMANAGYDFIWTEMQHGQRDWDDAARMWRTCPQAKAVPGVRIAYTDEREIQHALDAGALVLVVPTVDTPEEAQEVVNWAYFPPLGRRSNGGGQAFDAAMWGGVPGGYRATINDNLVLVLMIETLDGLKNAEAIAKTKGVTAVFAASGDLGNFTGYRQGQPDYERAINIVHDAALAAGVRLCGPFAWRDRPDFTCFQAGSETAAIARGAAAELGALANTQGKPEVGPFAVRPR
ncbi:MAG: HpcH/HpaI aldolase/citrate lyase family protein [Vicinamibacterales bacterium]